MSAARAAVPALGADSGPSSSGMGTDSLGAKPSIVSLIAEHTATVPAAEAVVCGSQSVSYAEMDARSTDLAVELRSLGAGRGSVVGLLRAGPLRT